MGWMFELWHEGNCLHEESGFDSEEEATEEGYEAAEDRIQMWKDDDVWNGETLDDFDVRVKEACA